MGQTPSKERPAAEWLKCILRDIRVATIANSIPALYPHLSLPLFPVCLLLSLFNKDHLHRAAKNLRCPEIINGVGKKEKKKYFFYTNLYWLLFT